MNLVIRSALFQCLFAGWVASLSAQTLMDLGPTAPRPGTNDIYQLSTQGDQTWPDGINYFSNNNPPAGQTFTTGSNAVNLATVTIKTAVKFLGQRLQLRGPMPAISRWL